VASKRKNRGETRAQHSNVSLSEHKAMTGARGSLRLLLGSLMMLLLAGLVAGSSGISLTINIVYPAGNLHPTDKLYLRYFSSLRYYCADWSRLLMLVRSGSALELNWNSGLLLQAVSGVSNTWALTLPYSNSSVGQQYVPYLVLFILPGFLLLVRWERVISVG
jgi:hypothetical protein